MHILRGPLLCVRHGASPTLRRHFRDACDSNAFKASCFAPKAIERESNVQVARNNMGKRGGSKWYAVASGRRPGIYESWAECQNQVKGFSGAVFKSFSTRQEAQEFCGERGGRGKHNSAGVAQHNFKHAGLKLKCTSSTRPNTSHHAGRGNQSHSEQANALHGSLTEHGYDRDEAFVVYFDGGSRGNPGPAGCGAAVYEGLGDSDPIATDYAYIGHATNNQAEYEGLILGLRLALKQGARSVTIRGDSMLVVNQVKGTWKANHESMRRLLDVVIKDILPRFSSYHIQHVYRNENGEADRLANQAMDSRCSGPLPSQRD
eukprot:jgi/Ulvmu1/6271/UM028_0129.1